MISPTHLPKRHSVCRFGFFAVMARFTGVCGIKKALKARFSYLVFGILNSVFGYFNGVLSIYLLCA